MTRLPILITAALPLLAFAGWLGQEPDVNVHSAIEKPLVSNALSLESAHVAEESFTTLQSREQEVAYGWTPVVSDHHGQSLKKAGETTRMRPVKDVSGLHSLKAAVYRFSYVSAPGSQQEVKRYSF